MGLLRLGEGKEFTVGGGSSAGRAAVVWSEVWEEGDRAHELTWRWR